MLCFLLQECLFAYAKHTDPQLFWTQDFVIAVYLPETTMSGTLVKMSAAARVAKVARFDWQ